MVCNNNILTSATMSHTYRPLSCPALPILMFCYFLLSPIKMQKVHTPFHVRQIHRDVSMCLQCKAVRISFRVPEQMLSRNILSKKCQEGWRLRLSGGPRIRLSPRRSEFTSCLNQSSSVMFSV